MFSNVKASPTLLRGASFLFANYQNVGIKHFSKYASLRKDFLSERIGRTVIKLSGADAPNFLQGLVTNDIRVLESSSQELSLYCMMLNTQGRVLYDLILYKVNRFFEKDRTILVECDTHACEDLIKTFSRYKLRKKDVSFTKSEEFSVWSVFPNPKDSSSSSLIGIDKDACKDSTEYQPSVVNREDILFISKDPRILKFGYRLLLPSDVKAPRVIDSCAEVSDRYQDRRFDFGLSEGITDLPISQCLPLESNLFFLNGVSFSKGCYVGQELTARSQHTGVIRKRIMPIFSRIPINLSENRNEVLTVVCEATDKECGKVRSWKGQKGIALLRLKEALLCSGSLVLKGTTGTVMGKVETFVPQWWPSGVEEIIDKVRFKQEKT